MDWLANIAVIIVFICVVAVSLDAYLRFRQRSMRWEYLAREASFPAEVAGIDATGELTTGAKYAIWNYMFSILVVGGTVIGILSGMAGYMIKDLATEKAIQIALNKMQEPLVARLAQFADAKSALDTAIKNVTITEAFIGSVATRLSDDGQFRRKIAEAVSDGDGLRKSVADLLMAQHAERLRGPAGTAGPAGPAGRDGIKGTSPSAAAVAQALNDDAFRTGVAERLVTGYANQLRGAPGAAGPAGPPGRDGINGTSPSAASVVAALNDAAFRTSVAERLVSGYADQLRGAPGAAGPAGMPGRDGANGTSPSAAAVAVALNDDAFRKSVAERLVTGHADQLRGAPGAAGPSGRDGISGTSPNIDEIAKRVVSTHGDQLRGASGTPGKNGEAGASPNVDEVAKILITKHREELRKLLRSRLSTPPRQPRGRG